MARHLVPPKSEKWHRDRIEELKIKKSTYDGFLALFYPTVLSCLALLISALSYFKGEFQIGFFIYKFFIVAFIIFGIAYLVYWYKDYNLNKRLKHNFDVLLDRDEDEYY